MQLYWILAMIFIVLIIYTRMGYIHGTNKAFRKFLGILIPLILAGTAIRIGYILLPKAANISYYIAGIGTIIFYIILAPIVNKSVSYRYQRISKESRWLGCILGFLQAWLLLATIFFFGNLFFKPENSTVRKLITIIELPLQFIWFSK